MMRIHGKSIFAWSWRFTFAGWLWVAVPAAAKATVRLAAFSAPQASPAPTISNVDPEDAHPGQKVRITIQGRNFVPGSYVTFSNPALHAISTHQNGNARITVEVQVAPGAAPGQVTLYVTNPSGASATFPFAVRESAEASPGPLSTSPANIPEPASPAGTPFVSSVAPPSAGPGSNFTLTIKGRNFVQGVRVAFSNPKITVASTRVKKNSELIAHVQIASDAAPGSTGLFVVNPDQSEVESNFQVGGAAINNAPAATVAPSPTTATSKSATTAAKSSGKAVSFNVFNLGDVVEVLKTKSRVQGTLSVDKGTLTYTEKGVMIFSVPVTDVQEINPNVFFGLSTGTFHIFLSSGKRYNFAAASLATADTQKIESQLKQALK
ncbi:MAG TPA: IPT/TIG domain-containing protein [Terriglobia bacterium]|nr:IPT/TIG domain-containing protein [Terriglobia bacterium]